MLSIYFTVKKVIDYSQQNFESDIAIPHEFVVVVRKSFDYELLRFEDISFIYLFILNFSNFHEVIVHQLFFTM
jgi:hypothetical protein